MSRAHPAAGPAAATPMVALYGRALTWKHLILTVLAVLGLMSGLAVLVGWWAWQNLAARVVLREQEVRVRLPRELAVQAEVSRAVSVRVDQTLPVRVPVRQALTIPLKDEIPIQVSIDTVLPLHLDVPVRQVIRIDQAVQLDTKVQTRVLGIPLTLPVRGLIPVQADVPVDLVIPVRQDLPVALVAPATVRIKEPLRTRIDTVIDTTVPVHAALSVPVLAPVSARLTFPQPNVAAGLNLMDVTVPFRSVALVRRTVDGGATAPTVPASRAEAP